MTITLKDVGSGFKRTAINENFDTIESELNNNVLRRDSVTGSNQMEVDIDMNSQRLLNLVDAINGREPVTLDQLNGALSAASSGLIAAQQEQQTGADIVGSVTTLTGITYTVSSNNLYVFRNGVYQTKGLHYNETSTSSITWTTVPNATDALVFITNLATTNSTTDTAAITHTDDGTDYNLATYLQSNKDNWDYSASNGARSIIRYYDANSVFVTDKSFTMSEFRVAGQYTRIKAPTWTTVDDATEVQADVGRFGSASATALNQWYAAFACADAGDVNVSTQAVPFLRVRSVATDTLTLGYAGLGDDELGGLLPAATYTWTPSELVGLDVLVISEGVLAGKLNVQGSRKTTITAATTTTLTLADAGSIGARDWILPAPSGFDFFRYLGAFYFDTAEVTNIYDSGSLVRYTGVANTNFTNNYQGSQASAVVVKLGGYISPLATAAILETKYTLATASLGDIFENFGGDISHFYDNRYLSKDSSGNQSVRHNNIPVTFLWRQEYAYKNSGSLVASKAFDEHYVYGWVEQ